MHYSQLQPPAVKLWQKRIVINQALIVKTIWASRSAIITGCCSNCSLCNQYYFDDLFLFTTAHRIQTTCLSDIWTKIVSSHLFALKGNQIATESRRTALQHCLNMHCSHESDLRPAAFYNLESGKWLAWANTIAQCNVHYAAIHWRVKGQLDQHTATPISHTRQ